MSASPAASGRQEPGGAQGGSPVPPPPYGAEPALEPGPEPEPEPELRGALDCLACAVLLSAHNLLAAALCALLCALVCAAALLPAGTALGLGFLCHSKFLHARVAPCEAHLHDAGATALLVLGFTLLLPLLVLGLAAFVRLARRLQLGYCLLPYSLAVYRNLPAGRYHQAAWCCPRAHAPTPADKVWV
ncbi:transmembrane protein 88 [Gopherus flavomarginatus]|uniref:transmembrane protein 88 n=1 Tax=Gopherus flavomarginatus TaxID=286002 RepID=UPI0021CBE945|nr:transmembrane protein 88 [Gopherus flavomarginatus]